MKKQEPHKTGVAKAVADLAEVDANNIEANKIEAKRPICSVCLRPMRACICACVEVIACATEVLILQHPAELKHIKGSARLLHMCLPQCAIWVGEQFDEEQLQQRLAQDNKTNILLYPDNSITTGVTDSFNTKSNKGTGCTKPIRLIVIDASWRQSRQMLAQNPLLQCLPRYALKDVPNSRYQIRRAHAPDQLSSLEACAYALMQLESANEELLRLLTAFDRLNQMQLEFGVHNLVRTKK